MILPPHNRKLTPAEAAVNEQEKLVDKAYDKYTEAAQVVNVLWQENSEITMFGDKAMRSFPKESKQFPAFQKARVLKDEAHAAWQREANLHGHLMVDLRT